jgi:hypothetical protein
MMVLQDSTGSIKACVGNIWKQIYKNKQFWLIGIWDYDILGVQMAKNELEPTVLPRPLISTVIY